MTRRPLVLLLALALAACGATSGATIDSAPTSPTSSTVAGQVAGPDRSLTSGSIDPSLTAEYLCSHSTRERRTATAADKAAVYAAYRLAPSRGVYVLDDLVPLELGGVNNRDNLWPQPVDQAHAKDVVENRLHRDVCAGRMVLTDAQGQMLNYGRGS